MSEDKQLDNDPERTLITLDQLSQTIEVMTSVVNRLRQHLSEQLKAQIEAQQAAEQQEGAAAEAPPAKTEAKPSNPADQKRDSFVVEIRQQENEPVRKNTKTLH